jgi:3-keto-5-aminohexanoate cleavage enzyme
VNFSTGWVGLPMAERVTHITELRPEIGALNMGSMNYAKYSAKRKGFVFDFVFENSFEDIIFLLRRMREAGVKPECECFDVGHVESVDPLVYLGVLRPPIQFSLIHGVLGGISATARNLAHMASAVPAGSTWGVIAVSRQQWAMVGAAMSLGGNVRVGFEDNHLSPLRKDGLLERGAGGGGRAARAAPGARCGRPRGGPPAPVASGRPEPRARSKAERWGRSAPRWWPTCGGCWSGPAPPLSRETRW